MHCHSSNNKFSKSIIDLFYFSSWVEMWVVFKAYGTVYKHMQLLWNMCSCLPAMYILRPLCRFGMYSQLYSNNEGKMTNQVFVVVNYYINSMCTCVFPCVSSVVMLAGDLLNWIFFICLSCLSKWLQNKHLSTREFSEIFMQVYKQLRNW